MRVTRKTEENCRVCEEAGGIRQKRKQEKETQVSVLVMTDTGVGKRQGDGNERRHHGLIGLAAWESSHSRQSAKKRLRQQWTWQWTLDAV